MAPFCRHFRLVTTQSTSDGSSLQPGMLPPPCPRASLHFYMREARISNDKIPYGSELSLAIPMQLLTLKSTSDGASLQPGMPPPHCLRASLHCYMREARISDDGISYGSESSSASAMQMANQNWTSWSWAHEPKNHPYSRQKSLEPCSMAGAIQFVGSQERDQARTSL